MRPRENPGGRLPGGVRGAALQEGIDECVVAHVLIDLVARAKESVPLARTVAVAGTTPKGARLGRSLRVRLGALLAGRLLDRRARRPNSLLRAPDRERLTLLLEDGGRACTLHVYA